MPHSQPTKSCGFHFWDCFPKHPFLCSYWPSHFWTVSKLKDCLQTDQRTPRESSLKSCLWLCHLLTYTFNGFLVLLWGPYFLEPWLALALACCKPANVTFLFLKDVTFPASMSPLENLSPTPYPSPTPRLILKLLQLSGQPSLPQRSLLQVRTPVQPPSPYLLS